MNCVLVIPALRLRSGLTQAELEAGIHEHGIWDVRANAGYIVILDSRLRGNDRSV